MKYCINFYKDFRYLKEVDEIIFPYSENLLKYISENEYLQSKRILINITKQQLEDIDQIIPALMVIKKKVAEMAVIMQRIPQHYNIMKNEKIPYIFAEYCKTFDQVYTFIKLGVSDLYVVETLGFNLGNIGKYCHDYGVKVRVLPNVAQATLKEDSLLPAECKFFIRPQDIYAYEEYVDVFELFGDKSKLSVTYEIYNDEEWEGDLNYLIHGLNETMYINSPVPFGENRLKCLQNCFNCNMCTRTKELHNKMHEADLKITREKKNEERGSEITEENM